MSNNSWTSVKHKFAVAVYNFVPTFGIITAGCNNFLSIFVGEEIIILEECLGWFRGYRHHHPSNIGIFPSSFVHILDCLLINEGILYFHLLLILKFFLSILYLTSPSVSVALRQITPSQRSLHDLCSFVLGTTRHINVRFAAFLSPQNSSILVIPVACKFPYLINLSICYLEGNVCYLLTQDIASVY